MGYVSLEKEFKDVWNEPANVFTRLDCTVGTTDRFLSSMSPFMCVESNSGVADPGAAAARPGTRVVEWLCAELPDCSSMLES